MSGTAASLRLVGMPASYAALTTFCGPTCLASGTKIVLTDCANALSSVQP